MADNAKAGLRQLMPSLFNGIATAIAAAAGFIGLLHQTGYLGNHRRMRAGLEARAPLHPREVDRTGQLAAAEVPAVPAIPASAGEDHPGRRRAQASEPERRSMARHGFELSLDSTDWPRTDCHQLRRRNRQGQNRGQWNRQRTHDFGAYELCKSALARSRLNPVRRRPRIVRHDQGRERRARREVAIPRSLLQLA